MSVEIIVPSLGESVSEATIAKWYKKPGDQVKIDELLLELETEKVTLEVNASSEGVLESITTSVDETVEVGQVIGVISAGSVAKSNNSDASEKSQQATDSQNKDDTTPESNQKSTEDNNSKSSNSQNKLKTARIHKKDALEELKNPQQKTNEIQAINNTNEICDQNTEHSKPVERVRMSRLRKTIAQRLKDSQNTAAILSTFNEIDMSNVIALRKKHRDSFKEIHGVKLGFMSFFVKAVTKALQEVPSVNAEMDGDDIIYKKYYDIGVAVGTEQGLVVPVVKNAHNMTFAEIEQQILFLATQARNGKLSMSDLTGGSFSITNGGVYGSLLSTPIINPPQTGIIGLHNTQDRPVAINGKVEIRPMMYIALSYDHRIIDGRDAVQFLISVKKSIEEPEKLLLNI